MWKAITSNITHESYAKKFVRKMTAAKNNKSFSSLRRKTWKIVFKVSEKIKFEKKERKNGVLYCFISKG